MKKRTASETTPQRRDQASPQGGAARAFGAFTRRTRFESVEQTIARVRGTPTLLDELGPETVSSIQRAAAEHPEVLGQTSSAPRRASR